MLDKVSIISTSVSEAVEKIPTDEKDYRKYSTVEMRKEFACFQVATSSLMLGRSLLAKWVHSNSLIKNLTPFEDDAEIRLFNFLM